MSLESTLKYIGKNVKPYWPTVAVASAELVFRPLFTMMDKKSPEETKKYTALREGITELIAAPTYLALPVLEAKASGLLKIKDAKAEKMAKHNLQILGTWVAALVVIPGLCSAVVKPFMDKIYDKKGKPEDKKLDITSKTIEIETPKVQINQTGNNEIYPKSTTQFSIANFANTGMKVGG